ncbi:MAG: helix-turn-helix domain-containing protein [Dermatophilaceae bacterium]
MTESGPLSGPWEERSRLRSWSGPARVMARAHRHDDLELNVSTSGSLTYVVAGELVDVPRGHAAMFWAAVPHQLVRVEQGTTVQWATVPFSEVLSWGMPASVVGRLVRHDPVVVPSGGWMPASWSADLEAADPELTAVVLLEIQARVRRLAYRAQVGRRAVWGAPVDRHSADTVRAATAMARHVVSGCTEPLTVAQVAAAAHLRPSRAMAVFREVTGTTIGAYLTRCRVAEAQRMLLSTDATTSRVAMAAGFGSQSSFYAQFHRVVGTSPAAWRQTQRRPP